MQQQRYIRQIVDEPVPRFDRIRQSRFLFGLEELQRNFTHLTQDGNRSIHKGTFACRTLIEPWKQKTFSVGHSSLSEDLINLATLIFSKKEILPQTQTVSRVKKMEFSDLRTRRNKRKRSSDAKVPNEKRCKSKVTSNKRLAESPCDRGVFKVPKIGKKEESNKGSMKEKSLSQRFEVESDLSLGKSVNLEKCNETAKRITCVSETVVEGLTVFPKLNFDTTIAIDQLFEDLDEDGPISPKLCSSRIIKRLSQTVDKTLSPKTASCLADSFDSPILAPKFSNSTNLPACSTPKQVKPERRLSRLSRLRNLPTVRPLGDTSSTGKSDGKPATPNFNFNLFLDECNLLSDDEPAPNNQREIFPGTSNTIEEENNVLHSVDIFTPIKRKWPDEHLSPGEKAVVNRTNESHTINPLEGSGKLSGKVLEASSLDDSFRSLKRRRPIKCLSPAPCEGSATTPSPKRRSIPGDAGVKISLLSSDDEDFIQNIKRCAPAKPNSATTWRISRVRDNPWERTNNFMEYKAEVSHDDPRGDDERLPSSDEEDRRFINDFPTQASKDMHAEYLKSVRSPPVKARGCFKIPTPRARRREDVLSDPEESYEDSYEKDSFCVDDEELSAYEPDTSPEIMIVEDARCSSTPKGNVKSSRRTADRWKRIKVATNSDSD